ncbi:MAG: hypothetical protein JNK15_15970 [Planctomycetes bacterium]|nr:hypothetical protein [Planctomycetota bacterium]
MTVRLLRLLPAALGLCSVAFAQNEPTFVGYPQKDALSPFRKPTDVYAPPDEVYRLLRVMQAIAEAPNAPKSFGADGREQVEDKRWTEAKAALIQRGVEAGYLAQIMRLNRNQVDRATAFYGGFYVANVDHVFELIAHIPGEPVRSTREAALPRAIEFLRAHLGRRFKDLPPEHRERMVKELPELGSPAARAAGITRLPQDDDRLHKITLVPFCQMLDLDTAIDQAQALWFLKEVARIREDLVQTYLEPALPRIRELVVAADGNVREQAIGLLQAIGGKDLAPPPATDAELQAWADQATKKLFPPIRNVNDAIVQLLPSPERTALGKALRTALGGDGLGDPADGQRKDGTRYRGFRIATVPAELKPLAVPAGAVITAVNGTMVLDAKSLLAAVDTQLQLQKKPRRLFVEYVLDGESRAVEYRLM